MRMVFRLSLFFCAVVVLAARQPVQAAEFFTVATYNLENYLDAPTDKRPEKDVAAKAGVRGNLLALRADVLALQELGSLNALRELRSSLKAEGLEYPHWELVSGFDTNVQVAVLSRFPFTARQAHTNEGFLLNGRRFRVSRGFAEVDVQVSPRYSFTLFTAHLKSRRPVPEADEAEMREQEALLLRARIDARLGPNPHLNLVVAGDFNDVKGARSTMVIIGRGRNVLIDTRPAERNGDDQPSPVPAFAPRRITWTHYFGKEDTYSRIDYILISAGMAHEWDPEGSYVLALPNWGVASDHRPIIARFRAQDN